MKMVTSGSAKLAAILEYAEERSLATGVVSNSAMSDAPPAACYAHADSRRNPGIFAQLLKPRSRDGVDGVIRPGRKNVDLNTARKPVGKRAKFDQIIARTAERSRQNTLLLFTADHSYGLRLAGGRKGQDIVPLVKVQAAHTAEEVLVAAVGPGSQHIKGAMENPEMFRVMLSAYGWMP